jgi:hypothetical protein
MTAAQTMIEEAKDQGSLKDSKIIAAAKVRKPNSKPSGRARALREQVAALAIRVPSKFCAKVNLSVRITAGPLEDDY